MRRSDGAASELELYSATIAVGAPGGMLTIFHAMLAAGPEQVLAREFRYVTLEHHRPTLLRLFHDGRYHVMVVVAHIVNAVSGKKIKNTTAIRRE